MNQTLGAAFLQEVSTNSRRKNQHSEELNRSFSVFQGQRTNTGTPQILWVWFQITVKSEYHNKAHHMKFFSAHAMSCNVNAMSNVMFMFNINRSYIYTTVYSVDNSIMS